MRAYQVVVIIPAEKTADAVVARRTFSITTDLYDQFNAECMARGYSTEATLLNVHTDMESLHRSFDHFERASEVFGPPLDTRRNGMGVSNE